MWTTIGYTSSAGPDEAVREFSAALVHLPQSPAEGPLYGIQLHMNLAELFQGLGDTVAAHDHLQIAQGQISGLDDRILRDIGLNRSELRSAAWDIAAH